MARFSTIASGSSGNCSYVGFGDRHFLVDVGVSGKRLLLRTSIPTIFWALGWRREDIKSRFLRPR
jgi:phosphoribosyl 1,2-cyclic phosphodiesterase